jgi:histidinol-phosphate phosphatase family protein
MTVDIVIPTVGRRSLVDLLCVLSEQPGPLPGTIYLIDDRPRPGQPLIERGLDLGWICGRVRLLRGGGRGPAAARNRGWRASSADWIAFLDDDVVPAVDWLEQLALDIEQADPAVAGSQGRVRVPLPAHRPPTDWERNVAGLEAARWITADMAYRRSALKAVDGFDQRFTRAFREDADLALRIIERGYRIVVGRRSIEHPARPAGAWISVRLQAGNADDALMNRLHGPGWHRAAGSPKGRRPFHLAITFSLAAAAVGLITKRRWLTATGLAGWAAGTAEFAWSRIAPGPRTATEVRTMVLTSALIPPAATAHWLSGLWRWRSVRRRTGSRPAAVLFDRDGTLVEDVPYNGDPNRVVAMPRARLALDRLRAAGILVGVVSNQSGVARGVLNMDQVEAVNRRLEQLLGPMDSWAVCPHGPADFCECRKPAPGLVLQAARALGVAPERCVVVGDIGSDVEAALAAGARAILVPTPRTRPEEVAAAPEVARDLLEAVDRALGGRAA